MTTHRPPRTHPRLSWALLLVLFGCGGMGTDDIGFCPDVSQPIEDDAPSPELELVVRDVLAWVRPSSALAEWRVPDGFTASFEESQTRVSLEISRRKGTAVEVMVGCGAKPQIQVPVRLALATEDGEIATELSTVLRASRPDFATIYLPFEPRSAGVDITSKDPRRRLVLPTLGILLTPDGSAGGWSAEIETKESGGGLSAGPGQQLLAWPAHTSCPGGTVPRETRPDEVWSQALTLATTKPWHGTAWDGTRYEFAIEADSAVCTHDDSTLSIPARLTMTAIDTPKRFELAGALRVRDATLHFGRSLMQNWGAAPQKFAERFGSFGLELEPYEHVELQVEFEIDAQRGAGTLSVIGYKNDCMPRCTASSCAGCGPALRTTLLEVTFSP